MISRSVLLPMSPITPSRIQAAILKVEAGEGWVGWSTTQFSCWFSVPFLFLKCSNGDCQLVHIFYSSSKVDWQFLLGFGVSEEFLAEFSTLCWHHSLMTIGIIIPLKVFFFVPACYTSLVSSLLPLLNQNLPIFKIGGGQNWTIWWYSGGESGTVGVCEVQRE